MKPRVTDEQFTQMLKEQEAGEKTANLCRRSAISHGTFYLYKSTYGGMKPVNAKRLKALKKENAR